MSFQWGVPVNRVTSAETLRRLEVLLLDDDFWITRAGVKHVVEINGPDHTSIRVQRDTLAEAVNAAWGMRDE